jgi:putative sterol carrier protein
MSDPTEELFERLAERGHEPLLARAGGTVRVELVDGKRIDYWRVTVERGDVTVARGEGPADCVARAKKELFDRLASGRANAVVATLRGDLVLAGDYNLGVLFQRIFPGPPAARKRRRAKAARVAR